MNLAPAARPPSMPNEKIEPEPAFDFSEMSPDEQALLERPISDLNLSVRARKCMVRLGLNTVGELVRKSGDDLLECKNFGVTSLNEVRDKLNVHGRHEAVAKARTLGYLQD